MAFRRIMLPQWPHTTATHGFVPGGPCNPIVLVGTCMNVGPKLHSSWLQRGHGRGAGHRLISHSFAASKSTSPVSRALFWAAPVRSSTLLLEPLQHVHDFLGLVAFQQFVQESYFLRVYFGVEQDFCGQPPRRSLGPKALNVFSEDIRLWFFRLP